MATKKCINCGKRRKTVAVEVLNGNALACTWVTIEDWCKKCLAESKKKEARAERNELIFICCMLLLGVLAITINNLLH